MIKKEKNRMKKLLPLNVPKWIRIYDNPSFCDRYTIVFTGKYRKRLPSGKFDCDHQVIGMSGFPYHPQGVCFHQEYDRIIDTISSNGKGYCWPPSIGRKNHLGTRISWNKLPLDCQKVVIADYKKIWELT